MEVTVTDTDTKKKERITLPDLKYSFPYINDLQIQKTELYNAFPKGTYPVAKLGGMPIASGGEVITCNDGRVFSRSILLRLDNPHPSHLNAPHMNLDVLDFDEGTGKKKKHSLGDLHGIPIDSNRNVLIEISESGLESVVQPISVVVGKNNSKLEKKNRELKKISEGLS